MEYLHGYACLHLDNKTENILVASMGSDENPRWSSRVADFGEAAADWIGTYKFMSPEARQV